MNEIIDLTIIHWFQRVSIKLQSKELIRNWKNRRARSTFSLQINFTSNYKDIINNENKFISGGDKRKITRRKKDRKDQPNQSLSTIKKLGKLHHVPFFFLFFLLNKLTERKFSSRLIYRISVCTKITVLKKNSINSAKGITTQKVLCTPRKPCIPPVYNFCMRIFLCLFWKGIECERICIPRRKSHRCDGFRIREIYETVHDAFYYNWRCKLHDGVLKEGRISIFLVVGVLQINYNYKLTYIRS